MCMFELHCNFIAAIVGDDDNMQVRIIATVIVVVVMFLVAIIIVAVLFFRRYILQHHIYPTSLKILFLVFLLVLYIFINTFYIKRDTINKRGQIQRDVWLCSGVDVKQVICGNSGYSGKVWIVGKIHTWKLF